MVFGLPLEDGSFGIAQAIDSMWENVVYVAIFSDRFDELPESIVNLDPENIVSLGATWKQDLNNGSWAKIGTLHPVVTKSQFPNEKYADSGYVGATNSDAGLFCKFLSAYHGLKPWNVMHQEDYWDKYLNAGKGAPSTIIVLNAQQREKCRLEVMGVKNA